MIHFYLLHPIGKINAKGCNKRVLKPSSLNPVSFIVVSCRLVASSPFVKKVLKVLGATF